MSIASKRYQLVLSAVHMVYRLVNSTYTVKELSLRLTRLLCQFVRASSASVYVLKEDTDRFDFVASYDNKINILQETQKELSRLDPQVISVTKGATVFKDHVIGLPLVTDDYVGALFVRRKKGDEPFNEYDKEMLAVFAEQTVTAIKNLQFQEQHEKIILGSIKSIGRLIEKQGRVGLTHTSTYVTVVRMLAERLKISHTDIKLLEYAALLHDVGAIDIPFEVLSKRSSLTPKEMKLVHQHTAMSVAFIKPVEFLKPILPIILHHHERYDGNGYPSGLRQEQIPQGAQIIAIVDTFEAMVQGRPYREAVTVERAIDEIEAKSGTQFNPKIVNEFLILATQKKFRKILSLLKH